MGLVARLLGRDTKAEQADRRMSQLQAATRERTRRELISMAVRDTLKKHGLPAGCITADALTSATSTRQRGMHIQFVFRDWQPSLLSYVVALELAVRERLQRLDPLSGAWITGASWRFDPHDRKAWPQLPNPGPSGVAPAPRRANDPARSAGALDKLLQAGDEAFLGARARQAVGADFSPTLPMRQ